MVNILPDEYPLSMLMPADTVLVPNSIPVSVIDSLRIFGRQFCMLETGGCICGPDRYSGSERVGDKRWVKMLHNGGVVLLLLDRVFWPRSIP